MAVDVVSLVDEGLGNSAYLVDLGDGRALVVDVSIDLRAAYAVAEKRGLALAFAADTHLHADFLSGAMQLAVTAGARILASAAGDREFEHYGLHDGDEVDLGGLRLRALTTPGHTHEHMAFALLDDDRTVGVFTGGSLIVGSAARTDLVSPDRTEELARAQYASLRRLASLPGEVVVWPTHGAGSFCSAPPGSERTSTIARERASNPLLAAPSEDAFVERLLGSLGSYPPYFDVLGERNRVGPPIHRFAPTPVELDSSSVVREIDSGAIVVDTRPMAEFAAGHIPGAVSIPLRPVFASWLGWLVPPGRPLVIARGSDQDVGEIAWQAAKIGCDSIVGEIVVDAWTGPMTRTEIVDSAGVTGRRVVDVRQAGEFESGHLPGALNIELGTLAARELPDEPAIVMCGHGERAMGAASLLERAGVRDVVVLAGGPQDWSEQTGRALEFGS